MYLGIDLGTSGTAPLQALKTGKQGFFRPADGGEVLPSIIYIDKRGHRLYGRRAHDQALISPDNVAAGFKRLMCTSTTSEIKGADLKMTPEECSAEIIRQLLGQASTETGNNNITGAGHHQCRRVLPDAIRSHALRAGEDGGTRTGSTSCRNRLRRRWPRWKAPNALASFSSTILAAARSTSRSPRRRSTVKSPSSRIKASTCSAAAISTA